VAAILLFSCPAEGQDCERASASPGEGYTWIGTIQPRHAREIKASNWSVGAETMDRDYTVYANWKQYLGPLGVKKARIQSGWAKTEKEPGKYDFAWFDEIVDDMVSQGVEPWICLCYDNPLYPHYPKTEQLDSPEAQTDAKAWERYVAAVVNRYKAHVDEWEVWNEAELSLKVPNYVEVYADLLVRTATVVRREQPQGQVIGFASSGTGSREDWVKLVLEGVKQRGAIDLIDQVSYHPYSYNPDSAYRNVGKLRARVGAFSDKLTIRQGENGAPSRGGSYGAIAKYDWNEERQAKWALRRLLGDLGRDIPSSYFSICDMRYPSRTNTKGLLAINDDKTVHHVKTAYSAIQNLTALFDDSLGRITDLDARLEGDLTADQCAIFGYRAADGLPLVALWRSTSNPGAHPDIAQVRLSVKAVQFNDPVWADLLTGRVYEMKAGLFETTAEGTVFKNLPVYDSPIVVAERNWMTPHIRPLEAGRNEAPGLTLTGSVAIANTAGYASAGLAAADLASDLEKVLGKPARTVPADQAQIVISLDESIHEPEGFRIETDAEKVRICGADELGVIYGIYRFSHQYLGVDPYWYFKDLLPEPREAVVVPCGVVRSKKPTFHYRGWFVNDEDLLTEWKNGGGTRFIDYPFYHQVTHLDVIDRVFEALLRAGGNLVIPASFVDVMNEPEARLVQRAAQRGLYVTQHHIEPLGVSHYGFENYWKAKGKEYAFAYGSQPDQVREVWRAFAQKWYDLIGDKVVWQLGLRGKGDRAIWLSDKSVDQAQAGRMISRAIDEQWEIVQSVDPRPMPPATTTLWHEGSQLMSQGALRFPDGITIVFADEGPSQTMQEDFDTTPRSADRRYGVYYHIGFWSTGPHLLQGSKPCRIRTEFDTIIAKGDTKYAIINVCNVREHVLGIQAATEIMNDRGSWSEPEFWNRFAPPVLHGDYEELLANLVPIDDKRMMQDGALFASARRMLASYAKGNRKSGILSADTIPERKRQLAESIERLDSLAARYPAGKLTPAQRAFHDVHLLTQTRMWREVYAFYLAVIEAEDDPARLKDAEAALERLLEVRKAAAEGKWENWYRGDKKVNVLELLEKTRTAREKLGG